MSLGLLDPFVAFALVGPILFASSFRSPVQRVPEPRIGTRIEPKQVGRNVTELVLLGLAIVMGWIVWPVLAVAIGLLALAWPRIRARQKRQDLDGAYLAALPETLDLVAVVIGSGGTVSEAMRVLQLRARPAIKPALAEVEHQRQAGQSLATALVGLPDVLGDGYRPLVRALLATERDGAPVSTLLVRLAEESEARRKREVEAKAKRLSVQLIFPLVTCFLPAVLLGAIVPLIAVSAGHLLR